MKKIVSGILLTLNGLLILLLLLFSGMMIAFTSAEPAELFGYTAVLVENQVQSGRLCILERRPAQIVPEDVILIRSYEGHLQLVSVERNDGRTVQYQDGEGEIFSIPEDDVRIQGRVVSENKMLGEFLIASVSEERRTITYTCIFAGFLFCVLAIVLVYLIPNRLGDVFLTQEEDRRRFRELLDTLPEEEEDAALADGLPAESVLPPPLNTPLTDEKGPLPQLRQRRDKSLLGKQSHVEDGAVSVADSFQPMSTPIAEKETIPEDIDATKEVRIYMPHLIRFSEPPSEPIQRYEIVPASLEQLSAQEELRKEQAPAHKLFDYEADLKEMLRGIEEEFQEIDTQNKN